MLRAQGSRHAREQLPPEALQSLATEGTAPVTAAVVVGDLRLSTLVMKEAVRPPVFARFIIGFTEAVRTLAHDREGWFDKFTGDGFVTFWLTPDEDSVDVAQICGFCQEVLPAAGALIEGLRRNSRNFPVGVGLSLGLDFGACELVRVGGQLTLVGAPIVGAQRMVSAAQANQALVNVFLGHRLERERDRLAAQGVEIVRTSVETKEFPHGQEAYRVDFARPTRPVAA